MQQMTSRCMWARLPTMAKEFSAPFAQKGGMEEYLKELIEVSRRWNTP